MLTPQKRAFVAGVLIGKSATQAAKDAGYSPKTAHAQACRLLKAVEVQTALADGRRSVQQKAGVDVQAILGKLLSIALAESEETPKLTHQLKAADILLRQDQLRELEALSKRLGEIEARLARLGPYERLHEGNGYAHTSQYPGALAKG